VSQQLGNEADLAQLQADLDLSRRELADARERLERALEEAADERRGRLDAEARLAALDAATDVPARPAVLGRITDRLRRQAP
jgi:hypothetical protein